MVIFVPLFFLAAVAALYLYQQLKTSKETLHATQQRISGIVDADAELVRVQQETEQARSKAAADAEATIKRVQQEADQLRNAARLDAEATSKRVHAELVRVQQETSQLRNTSQAALHQQAQELQTLQSQATTLQAELKPLEEEAILRDFGFYKPRYEFADLSRYQTEMERISGEQKRMLLQKTAAQSHTQWTVNGSVVEGRKQINQTLRLLLRAFNGECDAAIAKVKYNNVRVMEARITKAYEAINKLADVQQCRIAPEYRDLKMNELHLAHEYQEKVQEEKEEQRRIRERMREEEVAQRELERAQEDAAREEARYGQALEKARGEVAKAVGEKQQKLMGQIAELERLLHEARERKQAALSRAQMTKSGHVYVISNVGSFGEHVYKIGMTRRLDPLDRVRELGDASVPFLFDVHAVIFSKDAPALEATLHRAFHHRRVNKINERREFFRVSLDEIAVAVKQHHGEIAFTHLAEAVEYRKTMSLLGQGPSQQHQPSQQPAHQPPPKAIGLSGTTSSVPPPVVAALVEAAFLVQDARGKWSSPLSAGQIQQYVASGAIHATTRLRDASGKEGAASQHSAFQGLFVASPIAIPVPPAQSQVTAAVLPTPGTSQRKMCPACKTPAALNAGVCASCGHVYRTQFDLT